MISCPIQYNKLTISVWNQSRGYEITFQQRCPGKGSSGVGMETGPDRASKKRLAIITKDMLIYDLMFSKSFFKNKLHDLIVVFVKQLLRRII
jgi:hypothetical protein